MILLPQRRSRPPVIGTAAIGLEQEAARGAYRGLECWNNYSPAVACVCTGDAQACITLACFLFTALTCLKMCLLVKTGACSTDWYMPLNGVSIHQNMVTHLTDSPAYLLTVYCFVNSLIKLLTCTSLHTPGLAPTYSLTHHSLLCFQDQSKARKKHRIKRAASFLLYLVLAPLMIFGLGGFALSYGVLKGGSLTWASLSDPADVNKTTEGLADAWSQATNAWSDSMNKTLSKMGFDSFEDLWAESLGRGSDNKPHVFDQARLLENCHFTCA